MISPGRRIGPFELIGRIGHGGQGEVWLARPHGGRAVRWHATRAWLWAWWRAGLIDLALACRLRLAALKLAWPGMEASLHDEHGHLASPGAGHPHLTSLFGQRYGSAGCDLGITAPGAGAARRLYLALAYEPGVTLERVLRHRGVLALPRAMAVLQQVADALGHLHRRGIVHHDVRAANIVLRAGYTEPPHAVLIDLGAAEVPLAPRRWAIYGAEGHMPPERVAPCPAPPTPAVDIYGMGMLLRALTARALVSPELARLIADATMPDPADRLAALPDMAALQARLRCLPEAGQGHPSPRRDGLEGWDRTRSRRSTV